MLSDLHRHLAELVVVGFNSGKYDLNMLKDILIPHLLHRLGIDLAIKRHHAYLALRTGSSSSWTSPTLWQQAPVMPPSSKPISVRGRRGSFPTNMFARSLSWRNLSYRRERPSPLG